MSARVDAFLSIYEGAPRETMVTVPLSLLDELRQGGDEVFTPALVRGFFYAAELAALLNLSETRVCEKIAAGDFGAPGAEGGPWKEGRRWCVPAEAVRQRHQVPAAAPPPTTAPERTRGGALSLSERRRARRGAAPPRARGR